MRTLAFLVVLAIWSIGASWKNGEPIPASFPESAFGASGPLYQTLPTHPQLDANSESIVSYYFAGNSSEFEAGWVDGNKNQSQYDYNFPVYVASVSDPLVTIFCNHLSPAVCSDGGVQIRIPALARQAGGADHHLAVLEPDGTEYDFWLVSSNPPYRNGSRFSAAGEGSYFLDGTSRDANSLAPGFDVGSATAGGVALSIGQIYTSELAAGVIKHAIALVFSCSTNAWVFPASQLTGTCAKGHGMPLGSRVWWRLADDQTTTLPLARDIRTILIALHHYGGFFTDNGDGESNIDGRGQGMGAHIENQEPYWIYGAGGDPALKYAAHAAGWNHITTSSGVDRYLLTVPGSSVDFLHNLKVVAPCVTQKNC